MKLQLSNNRIEEICRVELSMSSDLLLREIAGMLNKIDDTRSRLQQLKSKVSQLRPEMIRDLLAQIEASDSSLRDAADYLNRGIDYIG